MSFAGKSHINHHNRPCFTALERNIVQMNSVDIHVVSFLNLVAQDLFCNVIKTARYILFIQIELEIPIELHNFMYMYQ